MSWFSARLLLETVIDTDPNAVPLVEESIRVVRAETEEEALHKAEKFGKDSEVSYLNDEEEKVRWVFIRVLEVQDISDESLLDGTEVYYEMRWKDGSDLLD